MKKNGTQQTGPNRLCRDDESELGCTGGAWEVERRALFRAVASAQKRQVFVEHLFANEVVYGGKWEDLITALAEVGVRMTSLLNAKNPHNFDQKELVHIAHILEIEKAKCLHFSYKNEVYMILKGLVGADKFAVKDDQYCRFGEWYYIGLGEELFYCNRNYWAIDSVYRELRVHGRAAVAAYLTMDFGGVVGELRSMEVASFKIIKMLNDLV